LAVELGELAADGAAGDALAAVAAHTGAAMAQLDAWDGGHASPVAVLDCPADVSRVLSENLPADAVFGRLLLDTGAPCLTDDPPLDFRRSPHFAEHFAPAGVATGLSVALRTPSGRTTGMLHLGSDRVGHFGERHRVLIAELVPILARAVDFRPLPLALLPDGFAVSRVHGGAAASVEGRDPAPVDRHVAALVARFAAHDAPYLRFLHPAADGWQEVRLVRDLGPTPGVLVAVRAGGSAHGLTRRELEILTAVATGVGNQQIAGALHISPSTVATHLENLLRKLAVASRTGAAVRALRDGLLLPSPDPATPRSVDRLLGGAAARFR
jgi:DNA-binding CsgD family transcriptional regulator